MPTIKVKNESPTTVWIALDDHREVKQVLPSHDEPFQDFNFGDCPTLRACSIEPDARSRINVINSVQASPGITGYPDYRWTGSSFEER